MKRWIVTAALALTLTSLTPISALADVSEGDAQTVSEGDIVVGDGVTATFDEETGAVVFYSDGGTLWNGWEERSGINTESIKSIKVAETSDKVYLPENSSGIFSQLLVETIDLSGFDSSHVVDMSFMFDETPCLRELKFANWDTSKVRDMSWMFRFSCCKDLDLSGLDTKNVTNMDKMFFLYTPWLFDSEDSTESETLNGGELIDLSALDMSSVTEYNLFSPCGFSKIKTPVNVKGDIPIAAAYIYPASALDEFELEDDAPYFDSEGNSYKYYPKGKDSILLMRFADVTDPSAWYHKAVYWAYANDVTSGYGADTFKPNAPLTRAQAVTFLYKFAGKPDVSGLEGQDFTDVAEDAWYHDAVKWAAENGITTGYGNGTFQPDAPCTRAMIVTFLANYAKASGLDITSAAASNFKDVASDAWYKASVDWAVANRITSGYGWGTFQPDVTCNRAMMVAFLKKL